MFSFINKVMSKKVSMWFFLLCIFIGILAMVMFGSAVRHVTKGGFLLGNIGILIDNIAKFPGKVIILFRSHSTEISPQILEANEDYFLNDYNLSNDYEGYLLVSSYDNDGSYVYLLDVESKKKIYEWRPPLKEIYKLAPKFVDGINTPRYYRSQHPLLFKNGDLVFSSGDGPLLRLSKCNEVKWIISDQFHHSIHLDETTNLIYAIKTFKKSKKNIYFLEDGFSIIDPESGNVLKEFSIHDILTNNKDNLGLLYGVGEFEKDRYHINSVIPIKYTDNFFEKDDLVISIRNLSTIIVFRPKEDKIVWSQTGPWINQHDARYLGEGKFSIFSNNIIRGLPQSYEFLIDHSDIYFLNLKNNTIERPFKNIFKKSKQRSGGIFRPIDDDKGIVELHSDAKIMKISKKYGVMWEHQNYLGNNKKGNINWSRYIIKDNINIKIFEKKCVVKND